MKYAFLPESDKDVVYLYINKVYIQFPNTINIFTPHAQHERGKVIGVGVHIICLYVCGQKKYLNRTLAIDSPFQTYAVGLLVEFIE